MHILLIRDKGTILLLSLENQRKNSMGVLIPPLFQTIRNFWKVTKPLFSNKVTVSNSITLSDNNEIHDDRSKFSQLFNDFFTNAVLSLNIDESNLTNVSINENDPILRAIHKYEQHPSIIKIKEVVGNDAHFTFSYVDNRTIMDGIYSLKTSKSNPQNSIPANIMKENCDLLSKKLHIDFLQAIDGGIFPTKMKNTDVSPVFKKDDLLNKSNYRPVSILPSDSKIFGKLMFSQINNFIDPYLSI